MKHYIKNTVRNATHPLLLTQLAFVALGVANYIANWSDLIQIATIVVNTILVVCAHRQIASQKCTYNTWTAMVFIHAQHCLQTRPGVSVSYAMLATAVFFVFASLVYTEE